MKIIIGLLIIRVTCSRYKRKAKHMLANTAKPVVRRPAISRRFNMDENDEQAEERRVLNKKLFLHAVGMKDAIVFFAGMSAYTRVFYASLGDDGKAAIAAQEASTIISESFII
jgi:hypothetical protein